MIYDYDGGSLASAFNYDGSPVQSAFNYDGDAIDTGGTTRVYRDTVDAQGKLVKSGQYIVSSVTGDRVALRGVGTHSLLEYTNLHTRACFRCLKERGVNMVRITVYLQDFAFSASGGHKAENYINHKAETIAEIEKIIEHCIALNLYVLLDWHVYFVRISADVYLYQTEAEEFFTYFAEKYADCPNMLWEIANEPYITDAADLMDFVGSIRSIIKTYVTDPILVMGRGSDGVDAMYSALVDAGYTDVFVSQHSYNSYNANTTARLIESGVPLVFSEWGNSDGTGDGAGNAEAAALWMDDLHSRKIMQSVWKFTDQTMTTSILKNRGAVNDIRYSSGFTDSDLSANGELYLGKFTEYAFETSNTQA